MGAPVNGSGPSFEVGEARILFASTNMSPDITASQYDVTRDGQRFLIVTVGETGSQPLTLVQNWTGELKK